MSRNRKFNRSNPKGGDTQSKVKKDTTVKSSESTDASSNHEGDAESQVANKPKTSCNDPEWYKKFPELAASAGNLPFSEMLGTPVAMDFPDMDLQIGPNQFFAHLKDDGLKNPAIPGIATLFTKPTYGTNFTYKDALNVAANQLYTNVRYVNSGRKNYDPADLMIHICAASELYSFILWCQRIYGYAFMYSLRNKYIPMYLISSNRINPDIVSELANFRYWINTFISRVSGIAVPSEINMFKRRAYMYAHLYTESTTGNIKDQLYQFAPDGFHRFELDSTGKGCLKYYTLPDIIGRAGGYNLSDLSTIGEFLLQNINGDEDFGLMSGDIIKSYGEAIIKLEPLPEAVIIEPEYEEYTLSQMRNASIANRLLRGNDSINFTSPYYENETFRFGDVMQSNNGNLVTAEGIPDSLSLTWDELGALIPGVITVTNPNPSIDDVLEATRLKTAGNPKFDSRLSQNIDAIILECGSEIVTNWTQMSGNWVNDKFVGELINQRSNVIYANEPVAPSTLAGMHFHWTPTIYYMEHVGNDTDGYTLTKYYPFENIDNYTTISYRNVVQLHEVAILSLLSVPGVAQLIG